LLHGRVLDVGCGTGEHVLLAAARGLDSTGIDASAVAIEHARGKAHERRLTVDFRVGDALALDAAAFGAFDTVIDTGLFHVFDDVARERYARSLEGVTRPGSALFVLCFSDRAPPLAGGPRRISDAELRAAFAVGWGVESIEARAFEVVSLPFDSFPAWLATMKWQ
jgi:SAM-dependent methyltransferase